MITIDAIDHIARLESLPQVQRGQSCFLSLEGQQEISAMTSTLGSPIIEDVFEVLEQDPDGQKFMKGMSLSADPRSPRKGFCLALAAAKPRRMRAWKIELCRFRITIESKTQTMI